MKFTSYAKNLSALALVALLAACGGGGSGTDGGSGSTVQPPVGGGTTAAPDGSDINSVISFAKRSGSYYALQNNVQRFETTQTIDGTTYTAWVDSVPGIGDAVVGYRVDNNQMVYTLNGDVPTAVTGLSGVYTGSIDMSYRMSPSGDWQVMSDNAAIQLDLQAGTFNIDSVASNGTDGFEVFGTGTVTNQTLASDTLTVRHRDGSGAFVKDYTGTIGENRMVQGSNGPDNLGLIGKFSSSDADGFEMNGAFDTQYSQQYN